MSTTAEFKSIKLEDLRENTLNPRRHYDPHALEELTASITAKGVLQPLVVRRVGNGGAERPVHGAVSHTEAPEQYEVVAGSRRLRAAKAAGLAEIPCVVRVLTDQEVLEVMVIENLQREDVHPLEEAEGYRSLIALQKGKGTLDAAAIAARVGRSVKYVYDRMKLLALTKEAQQLFWDGRITAGHAILLARLSAADQKRVIDPDGGGLFEGEKTLYSPEEEDAGAGTGKYDLLKPVSVRELQAYIDEHVKFDKAAAEPMLFPDTVAVLDQAKEEAETVIQITHDHYVQEEARDRKERIFGPRSWARADGKHDSKPCDKAVTGVIVVGPGRGEAFKVCTDKKGCKVHWKEYQREAAARAKRAERGESHADLHDRQREREENDHARRKAASERWEQAYPKIMEALAAAVKQAPTKATGLLASIIFEQLDQYPLPVAKKAWALVPRGITAEDFIRHAAFVVLTDEASRSFSAPEDFPKRMKAFGLDAKKIVDEAAPATPVVELTTCKVCDAPGIDPKRHLCAPAALKKAKKKHGPHRLSAIPHKNRVDRIAKRAKARNGRKRKAA